MRHGVRQSREAVLNGAFMATSLERILALMEMANKQEHVTRPRGRHGTNDDTEHPGYESGLVSLQTSAVNHHGTQ
jgi:hypothetical protein